MFAFHASTKKHEKIMYLCVYVPFVVVKVSGEVVGDLVGAHFSAHQRAVEGAHFVLEQRVRGVPHPEQLVFLLLAHRNLLFCLRPSRSEKRGVVTLQMCHAPLKRAPN